ncbi:MAG TPA: TIGR02300 family protein [Xanthobacteraceae bacterium]|nr:TIGR02300 family protein [Xanthobacteraceae bacterium]
MAKPELGTKRLCAGCGAKFYDLNKDPIHCPKCGTVYEVAPVVTRGGRPDAAAAARPAPVEPVAAEAPEVETVSLEEADAEASGAAKKPAAADDAEASDDDVEIDETLDDDDDTFIEEQEDEDADVTDIIGGDIENEEEG